MARKAKTDELSALEGFALRALGKKAEKRRDELAVGSGQPVDVTLRIVGAIDVQPDINQDRDVTPKAEDLLSIVLAAAGPRTRKTLVDALAEAYQGLNDDERPEIDAEQLRSSEQMLRELTHKRTGKQRGHVVASLKIEKLAIQ